jgi:hypothetical protein
MKQAEKDEKVLRQIGRGEVRWYHFLTPIAINVVTDGECTDSVKRLARAGRIELGEADPGSYSVPSLIERCEHCPAASTGVCCSSHGKTLCHRCYRQTHFVEVCVDGCRDCDREGLPLKLPGEAGPGSTSPEPGPEAVK